MNSEAIVLKCRLELEGMLASNKIREQNKESLAYTEEDFISLRRNLITELTERMIAFERSLR